MSDEQKIEKTSNDLLNIQPSKKNMPGENTMDLNDGMIITPSFYKKNKKSAEEKKDFSNSDDEEPILELESGSFLDDEDQVDVNAQTIAISKDSLNSSEFLPFTDSENQQDSKSQFDSKTIFAPGGDLDSIEIKTTDKVKNADITSDDAPAFELEQEIPEQKQSIDINADTISNTKNNISISENKKSDFDTKTIIAPNGDLDSLDFDDPVEEDFDINAETVIYSEPDINEISESDRVNSETITPLPEEDEPLDLDDILDTSDKINPSFNDFSENILQNENNLEPEAVIEEEAANEDELSVRDSTTMDGSDAEDAVISLEQDAVIIEDDDTVLELGAEAVIEPDLEDNQDIDFKQAAETIALMPETDEPETDEDDILDLDILQNVSEDQPEDQMDNNTQDDIPILTSEDTEDTTKDTIDANQDNDVSALDLINNLDESAKSSEIEEPENFLDVLDSEPEYLAQEQGIETIDEPEPEAAQETVQKIDELTFSISSVQIEASLERVINKIFSERIEKILTTVVEKAVSEEISKLRASFIDNLTD